MGYVFERQESIATNVNRILAELVNAAIDALENPGESREETVHGVRKRIKKVRALLRLIRRELDEDVFRRANSQFRSIGQQLSHIRDATVMMHTIEKLQQTHSAALSPNVFVGLKKALAQKQELVSHTFFDEENTIKEVADALRQAPQSVLGLSEKHDSFSVLAPNLKGIYRRGRKALKLATQEPSSHNLHELRKEVKTIWYHTLLLKPIWPGLFGAYGQEFGRLGELLGDDHDFGVLAEEIESDLLTMRNRKSKETVLQLLHDQRTALQEQLFPLANRLFAEKSGDFVDRYRRYWKLWRAEVNHAEFVNNVQAA